MPSDDKGSGSTVPVRTTSYRAHSVGFRSCTGSCSSAGAAVSKLLYLAASWRCLWLVACGLLGFNFTIATYNRANFQLPVRLCRSRIKSQVYNYSMNIVNCLHGPLSQPTIHWLGKSSNKTRVSFLLFTIKVLFKF